MGIDIDEKRVNSLNEGKNYISDVDDEKFGKLVQTGALKATTDFSCIKELDVLSICVPTPLNKLKDPDVSFINHALSQICQFLHEGLLIVLESTTYPGTTQEELLPILQEGDLRAGQDFFLAYSPEREDPGNKTYTTHAIPKLVGGYSADCLKAAPAHVWGSSNE